MDWEFFVAKETLLEENEELLWKGRLFWEDIIMCLKMLDGLLMNFMLIYIADYIFFNILLHKFNMCMMLLDSWIIEYLFS